MWVYSAMTHSCKVMSEWAGLIEGLVRRDLPPFRVSLSKHIICISGWYSDFQVAQRLLVV